MRRAAQNNIYRGSIFAVPCGGLQSAPKQRTATAVAVLTGRHGLEAYGNMTFTEVGAPFRAQQPKHVAVNNS